MFCNEDTMVHNTLQISAVHTNVVCKQLTSPVHCISLFTYTVEPWFCAVVFAMVIYELIYDWLINVNEDNIFDTVFNSGNRSADDE